MMTAANRYRGAIKRYRKSQDGTTAVEFALVGAPFLYMLLMIFELAIMLFTEYVVEQGVAEASRQIRTGQVQAQNMSASDFKTAVCGSMAAFLKCNTRLNVDVRTWTSFANINQPSSTTTTGGETDLSSDVTTNAQFNAGTALDVVTVKTYYAYQLYLSRTINLGSGYIGLANLSNNRRLLTAGAVFRNEPFN